jgi:predicted secreted protein
MSPSKLVLLLSLAVAAAAHAQPVAGPSTSGTMVVVPAFGEVKHANDEAVVTFSVEEHDKDKVAAASRVNRKMKEGMEILRRADPSARLKTIGYFTVPVYQDGPQPQPLQTTPRPPVPVAWRVGQSLELKTSNLAALEKTAAAAQQVLAISNLTFGLAKETEKRLDDQRIAETYRNLNERIASIAAAMGRKPSEAVLDTVDFEASGNYAPAPGQVMMYASRAKSAEQVAEPSFEPGETTLQMRLVGKVKFK